MHKILGGVLAAALLPLAAFADGVAKPNGNTAERGGITANLLQDNGDFLTLHPYDSNYLLYTFTDHINKKSIETYDWGRDARRDEVAFQFSVAFPFWRGILGDNSVLAASYTQRSWWQLTNRSQSAPFRETNYEPQLFLGFATDYRLGDWTLNDVEVGFDHQSNGRAEPTSRSWNRAYTRLRAKNGNWLVEVRPWFVVGNVNDNPDITRYTGYYQLKMAYALGDTTLSLKGQYNWNTGYGGAELGASYPITQHMRLYGQIYSGYGESLIDYNFNQTRIGLGIMLNDIL
ncbi:MULTISPECIES: phospholipase A [Tenebrionibacter/Tenebrionicola group]|jgi:phospholipase A1|uniref:Phospholipase A1 n=2 Tax=Tenebrionibacter/Tenebrionicola group TaxID=2969848 RepID=A0A8K0V143_9ENTR|nr:MULTISPECIES: phospholipase A [Tenebrionibacter/Tenebrionicola group]MBK4714983.1 phospholipase A [Tenebrionibacter intestinalis]MBV4414153.1 phospholipase A [Tenebrionicola larvae]MBV5095676.1 phospholipase A [Tenebrionicola larvae]